MTAAGRAVLVAVGVALAVACSSEPAIERAELLREGDAVCRRARDDVQQQVDEAVADGSVSEAGVIREVLLPGVRAMFDDVESLGTPEGDGDELQALYGRVDDLLADAAEGDLEPSEFDRTYDAILADLREYGFTDCAEDGA